MKIMTTKILYWSLLILSFLLCSHRCKSIAPSDCGEILLSPIMSTKIEPMTRAYIPIAAVARRLDNITFSITDAPSFLSIQSTQRGRAIIIADPSHTDLGNYQVTIAATDGTRRGCISFELTVAKSAPAKRIIHCDPTVTAEDNIGLSYGKFSSLLDSGFKLQQHDLIILHDGNHGDISLTGSGFTIATAKGAEARLTSLTIADADNISINGIVVRPASDNGDHNSYLVLIDSTCHNIDVTNSCMMSTTDATMWSEKDWNSKASRGIKCRADHCNIIGNLVQNVFHGIKTEGNNITIKYNHVDRFGGDAIRNTGSDNTYNFNFLTNATIDDYYADGGNHDDLFQSWTFDKPIDNIKLANNVMISCLDTLMPLRAKIVQGLVCFDGFETNWQVNNNLIVTDHPHGIALYGAENCTVDANTVLKNPHNLYHYESDPWIMINNHKDGRKSSNNVVRNNTTTALNITSENVQTSDNLVLDSTSLNQLKNYHEWDFRIKE